VTLDEIRTTLFTAATLRIPRFDERDTTGMRIEKLEDYLLTAAVTSGELEEGRLYCYQALHDFERQWRNLQGWEIHLPNRRGTAPSTQPQIVEAKRLADPGLYENIVEMKFLVARLSEQIHRLHKMADDQVASRIYTLMAGN
jgi:hypothetical protein